MNTPRQQVELFHLLFLDQLSKSLDGKLYAVKGGCNLRFFFKSIRYSEDLDLDVKTIAVSTLQNKINRIFSSTPFQQILKTRNFKIKNLSTPKQTETTQRWKLTLTADSPLPLHTKIEFSRRKMDDGILFEALDPSIIQSYQLMPILLSHYNAQEAFTQKVKALAGRPQTQARDIFDLFLLTKTGNIKTSALQLESDLLENAQASALTISFNDFKSQVVVFLMEEYQAQYDSPALWDQIVSNIFEELERLKP